MLVICEHMFLRLNNHQNLILSMNLPSNPLKERNLRLLWWLVHLQDLHLLLSSPRALKVSKFMNCLFLVLFSSTICLSSYQYQ